MTKDELKVIKDKTKYADNLIRRLESTTAFIEKLVSSKRFVVDNLEIAGLVVVDSLEIAGMVVTGKGNNQEIALHLEQLEMTDLKQYLLQFFQAHKAGLEKELQAL